MTSELYAKNITSFSALHPLTQVQCKCCILYSKYSNIHQKLFTLLFVGIIFLQRILSGGLMHKWWNISLFVQCTCLTSTEILQHFLSQLSAPWDPWIHKQCALMIYPEQHILLHIYAAMYVPGFFQRNENKKKCVKYASIFVVSTLYTEWLKYCHLLNPPPPLS